MTFFILSLLSADNLSREKAVKALVDRAEKFYLENGEQKAFEEFNKPAGKFVEGELYLFVYDMNGKCFSHGANKALIGQNLINLKDPNGKLVIKELVDIVKKSNEGWSNFIWAHPQTKKNEPKRSYVKRIGKKDILVGCGYYLEK